MIDVFFVAMAFYKVKVFISDKQLLQFRKVNQAEAVVWLLHRFWQAHW